MIKMKHHSIVLRKIVELENKLNEKREIIFSADGQNLDMDNEPLFNQVKALLWALDISSDESIDELDIELLAK